MNSEDANKIIQLQMESITNLENKNEALNKDNKVVREENKLLEEEKKELEAHIDELEDRNRMLNKTIKTYKLQYEEV